ncbi:hypothetical protein DPMN_101059 [Dreissena polymorpha]|uniref:Uncharacterized protein n=1 Tax=Dreissena polymorpha TaxID=45954 RepID=A0A9D4R7Z8_DREPO|nr:hypothetical protein DPMN_101059 [Dreissena polymorpha]
MAVCSKHETTTALLTKFHYDLAKNVTSRVFTSGHVFRPIGTIFKLIRDINKNNVFTKFHDDWAKKMKIHVFQRNHFRTQLSYLGNKLFTCFHYIHLEKTALPTGGHVFSPIWTILEFVQDINKTNVLTKFHDDWAKIVTSRVFTRKTAPPTGGNVFQQT